MKTVLGMVCVVLALSSLAMAAPLNVVVIDAGHTMTGKRISHWLAALPETKVTTLDLAQLRRAQPPRDGVIVWIAPAPALFNHEAASLWTTITKNREIGLMIVGLEESDVARFSGGNADEVRTISEGLGMQAYYGPRTVTGTFGIALLFKYPLENPHTFFMYSSGEQTAAIQAHISLKGKSYTILVTHLGNDGPLIQQQQVLERLNGQQNVIAMGDFNFDPSTPQYKLTLQTLQDAWVISGSVPTAGLDMSQMIDHVFVSPGLAVRSARYVNSPASDHPSLLVEIQP